MKETGHDPQRSTPGILHIPPTLPEPNLGFPLTALRITNKDGKVIHLDGKDISPEIDHDINEANLTVTFIGVTKIEVDYKPFQTRR